MIRLTNYAGSFYPEKENELNRLIDIYLSKVEPYDRESNTLGVIVPHAGYVYSGATAAYAYKYVQQKKVKRVFLIAPSHRGGQTPFSVLLYRLLKTPLGNLSVDQDIAKKLSDDKRFFFNSFFDRQEHSLEVQLPFLYRLFQDAKIIPIMFNHQTHDNALYLADILEPYVSDDDHTLIVISSDFSHYYDAEIAEKMDMKAAELICQLYTELFFESNKHAKIEACGLGGIITMMELSKRLGYNMCKLLKYSHSGMVSNDNSQVVGYASLAFDRE